MRRLLLRVYFTDDSWLGPGKIEVLEAIVKHQSISAAARAIGMSYRRAWLLVDAVNRMFLTRVVETTPGGRHGGIAVVTAFGQDVIKRYRTMERSARRVIDRQAAPLDKVVRSARGRSLRILSSRSHRR